jgi:hypothetical protein
MAAWSMTRIRHRQSFRAMRIYAPGFTSLPLLLLSGRLLLSWPGSRDASLLYAGALGATLAIAWFLNVAAPPTVLFLGASQYEEFRIMKRLHAAARCYVISLMDQASPSVLRQYHDHYKRIRSQMPPLARMVYGAVAPFMDPTGPRLESVRTRRGLWRRTALDLIDQIPVVVLDARNGGRQVQQEAIWMLAPERRDRALFVVDDDGGSPLFDELHRLGVALDAERLRVVTEGQARESLRTMTRQAASFQRARVLDARALRESLARAQEE